MLGQDLKGDHYMEVGTRIRELRKERRLKLYELAEKSGVQIATLSRMEHNKMTGTLESHLRIAAALEVELGELYAHLRKSGPAADAPGIPEAEEVLIHNDKTGYLILAKNISRKKMLPVAVKIEPGGQTREEALKTGAEKFIYALSQPVEIIINGKPLLLKENYCLYFDASLPHYYRNPSNQTCRALVVQTPAQI
jgi:transcriptional regulator with XRE-family HTH domain